MVWFFCDEIKMKLTGILLALFLTVPTALFAEDVKHVTVNNYLQQSKAQGKKSNNLINETSPYLLQHAYNPVNWYAWGDDAFEKARKENKPIFLSIGYSTCHWCHVMAHESFENKKIANLLNKHFVAIKVDREQRPDIDSVYMSATQLINGQGGWPMSVFLDHKLRPFHAATYYPPFSTDGRIGLNEVLLEINRLWLEEQERIIKLATVITKEITKQASDSAQDEVLDSDIQTLALQQIETVFDEDMGGFSAAPKFPRPGIFSLLNKMENNKSARHMMRVTLDAMASGGIYDQLGGGFHRYSVDANWQVPHFEKMLYSQALMVMAYSDFYQTDSQGKYKNIIYQTLGFVKAEMQSPMGGFYSALDADSERADKPREHAEGAYYLWGERELKKTLSSDEFLFIKEYYLISENGNIDSDPRDEFINLNIFSINEDYRGKVLTQKQKQYLSSIKKKLNKKRLLRPRPHLDDKVITAWNGMMLSAFSKAAMTFDDVSFLDEAIKVADFMKGQLYSAKDKKLFRQYRDNKASVVANLSDYVWLINGLLKLHRASKDGAWLNWALELQQQQNQLFLDKTSTAYYESVANDKNLLFRSKNIYDGALPSANAIALANLRMLSNTVESEKLRQSFSARANKLVNHFAGIVNQNPAAAASLVSVEMQAVGIQVIDIQVEKNNTFPKQ